MISTLEFDLANAQEPLPTVSGEVWILVRSGTRILGEIRLSTLDPLFERDVRESIERQFAPKLKREQLIDVSTSDRPKNPVATKSSRRIELAEPPSASDLDVRTANAVDPTSGTPDIITPADISIVVCTRDRPHYLRDCLTHLQKLNPAPGEIIVVDNASQSTDTMQICRSAGVERISSPIPGLDRARNTGYRSANGKIIAYVDDDARVDTNFAGALAEAFLHSEVGAVTGLVLAAELETEAQILFERQGGMRKGFRPRLFRKSGHNKVSDVSLDRAYLLRQYFQSFGNLHSEGLGSAAKSFPALEAFHYGVGTNMSFRMDMLSDLGGFDPRLDVGTPTRGGGDLDMLFRVIEAGGAIHYDPQVMVRHIHRRTMDGLRHQMFDNGVGFSAFLAKCRQGEDGIDIETGISGESSWVRPTQAESQVKTFTRKWHVRSHLRPMVRAASKRNVTRLRLAMAETRGSLRGTRALEQSAAESRLDNRSTDPTELVRSRGSTALEETPQ